MSTKGSARATPRPPDRPSPAAHSEKLDFPVSRSKSTTSHFLIDNSCTLSRSVFLPASNLKPPTSRTSNRQYEILEPHVSHRKQRTGNFLIANFRPMFRKLADRAARGSGIGRSLSLVTCHSPLILLIANDMHSRKQSSNCKQSTYEILIANEFHLRTPRWIRIRGLSLCGQGRKNSGGACTFFGLPDSYRGLGRPVCWRAEARSWETSSILCRATGTK